MKTYPNSIKKVLILCAVIMMTSCVSRQQIAYFQDEPFKEGINDITSNFELRFKSDDLLTINVSSIDPEVAIPFNLPAVSYNTTSVISGQGTLKMQTYLIDRSGNIEFPVIGTIKIGGLSRSEANTMMKEKLTEYIKDPIVNIRLANFTITILGEVARPGTFTIQDEKVSLAEALGLAGDLTIYGRRDNVFLIREVDGIKRYATLDLTSINVVNSPNYYLRQNDVIYVEPNNSRIKQSSYNQNTAVIIAAISTLATIAAIFVVK